MAGLLGMALYTVPKSTSSFEIQSHYAEGGVEPIDVIKAKYSKDMFMGFLMGNVVKYVLRAPYKDNALQDYKKAGWYLNRAIKELEE